MKLYIIPDIHEDVQWADWILASKPEQDRAIFLGDYFHQFHQDRTEEVCFWLKRMFQRTDVDLLLGNHDLAHVGFSCGVFEYLCSGYTQQKQEVFAWHFPSMKEFLSHFSLCRIVNGPHGQTILSHAGVTYPLYQTWKRYRGDGTVDIDGVCRCALSILLQGKAHQWLLAGCDRGGSASHGGITWCDWRRFEPVPGVRQIVGHTSDRSIRRVDGNVCLDANQTHYGILHEDGYLEERSA